MLRALAVVLAASLTGCAAPRPSAPVPGRPDARAAFARLRALVGEWEATTAKGTTLHVSYRLFSHDSALVETFGATAGKQTLTVFHLDGARVIATHYCAQMNQPRLALRATPDERRFEFAFFDATNLPDPRASHLVELDVALGDADHFDKTETYEEAGKPDVTVFAFHRVAP